MEQVTMKHTGNLIIDAILVAFVWVFAPIYDFIVTMIPQSMREFFIESREVILWLTAVLVFVKLIKDVFFPKKK